MIFNIESIFIKIIFLDFLCTDEQATQISFDLSKKIQNDMTYPGQIKITVIRETRSVNYAR